MILCIGTTPAAQRVMVFGKLTLDAVNRARTTQDGAAGKSINVAKVLRVLGERAVATGFLGGPRGEFVRGLLGDLDLEFIEVEAPTRQCTTVIDESTGKVTELVEESRPVAPGDYEKLTGTVRRLLPSSQAAVMSGTITPGGPTNLYRVFTEMANAFGVMSVVDAQGPALVEALQASPSLVKPNRLELAATVGRPLEDESSILAAMRELNKKGARRVVVTGGKLPTLAYDGSSAWRVLAQPIPAVNPIGSGDAFTAALTWRLLKGDELGEACRWGSAAGAANALTPMPGDLNRQDVERLAGEVQVERLS